MRIIDLDRDDEGAIEQCARLVIEGLTDWPDLASAVEEVRQSLEPGRISRVAVDDGQKLGFTTVGVVPDANGLGKPDILMAKRVGTRRSESRL